MCVCVCVCVCVTKLACTHNCANNCTWGLHFGHGAWSLVLLSLSGHKLQYRVSKRSKVERVVGRRWGNYQHNFIYLYLYLSCYLYRRNKNAIRYMRYSSQDDLRPLYRSSPTPPPPKKRYCLRIKFGDFPKWFPIRPGNYSPPHTTTTKRGEVGGRGEKIDSCFCMCVSEIWRWFERDTESCRSIVGPSVTLCVCVCVWVCLNLYNC